MIKQWLNRLFKSNQKNRLVPALNISKIMSYEDYIHYSDKHRQTNMANFLFEKNLVPEDSTEFTYNGYCYVCKTVVDFSIDFKYTHKKVDGVLMPNWRERLECPVCHLNNRMRAVVHVFYLKCRPDSDSIIYITEQTTALYKLFKQSFSNICGSEYLGDSVSYGSCNSNGIRNEDLTQLSFSSNQFDFILSFDVFEHVPNYKQALAECYRCIKPGGVLFFSVPFVQTSEKNVVRAYVSEIGEIVHLLPPEYHGDPINPEGSLCFHYFGWEILADLKTVGFTDPYALFYESRYFGYLGGEQVIFVARKRKAI